MPKIQMRRGTAASWNTANPVLDAGEFGYETDTGKFKIGDGTTKWNGAAGDGVGKLGYAQSGALAPTPQSLTVSSVFSNGATTWNGASAYTLDLPSTIARNAQTATTLATARNINGASFDGSANVIVGGAISGATAGAGATFRNIFVSPSGTAPTNSVAGDVWIAY